MRRKHAESKALHIFVELGGQDFCLGKGGQGLSELKDCVANLFEIKFLESSEEGPDEFGILLGSLAKSGSTAGSHIRIVMI